MYTECPHCQTLFRIRADQIRAAQGTVRCGRCQEPFDSLLTLCEAVAPSAVPRAPDGSGEYKHAPDGLDALVAETFEEQERAPPGNALVRPPSPRAAPGKAAAPELPARLREMLAAAEAKPASAWRPFGAAVSLLTLTLVLALQVLYFRPGDVVATAPLLTPWVHAFCGQVGCESALRRDPERIAMLSHDVRSHPEVAGALLIKATFANQADFGQPFPDIAVTLSDLTDTVVAKRRFTPADYLPAEMIVSTYPWEQPMMAPETPVYIDLEVLDPGKQALNYQFDFF